MPGLGRPHQESRSPACNPNGARRRTPGVAFDISQYTRVAGRLDISDLDLRVAFAAQPLEPDALRYTHDIESHTVCYLRDLW